MCEKLINYLPNLAKPSQNLEHMIRIGIVDDHQIVINGLSKILNGNPSTEVVFSSTHGSDLLKTDVLEKIDVLLMDIEMPEMDGVDLAKSVLSKDQDLKILMLSMYKDKSLAEKLKDIGVRGYLSKNTDDAILIEVIQEIQKGNSYFKILRTRENVLEDDNKTVFYKEKIKELSERELEILRHIVEGMSNKDIGDKLHISHRTVDTHRTNIMRKLDASNVASLVRIALKTGVIH